LDDLGEVELEFVFVDDVGAVDELWWMQKMDGRRRARTVVLREVEVLKGSPAPALAVLIARQSGSLGDFVIKKTR
jgi:hypothetical protein